ncbi:prolyl 4-hydroxylase subunit alpha-1 [Drosophila busckii]|uniref:prolyl 4-hydroxylase subunit alpha-1 n=1 Tax=Drosophila busckii TaxID=30019 RepID=UPI00083EBD08|nr:prolyl 4-hydroxylase subunit alpha-1 [Drosophila busckii]
MQMRGAVHLFWLICLALGVCGNNEQQQLRELLETEATLIGTLRDYTNALNKQLLQIRAELRQLEQLHEQVGEQVAEHMGNPLNVLRILKRFSSLWPQLQAQANATYQLNKQQLKPKLKLPSEADYEAALLNLLRLQTVYELKPDSLALGVAHGEKLGSAMSWSDCLEVARKSDYAIAKYWLDIALAKLQANGTAESEQQRGKLHILEAALKLQYGDGEFASALHTAEQLLLLRPNNQQVLQLKQRLEATKATLPMHKPHAKPTAEQQLTAELCRAVGKQRTTGSRYQICQQSNEHLHMLRLEQLSADPYIMLYHNMLSPKQTAELVSWLDPQMKFNTLAQQQLLAISRQLDLVANKQLPPLWQARRHSHEHVSTTLASEQQQQQQGHSLGMLNLRAAKLGGAIVFPQLELAVLVPTGALLYFQAEDYRSRQLVCPVLLGAQLSAWAQFEVNFNLSF